MPDISVRDAREEDAAAIAEIYNYYILNTVVTFDTAAKSVRDRADWIHDHDPLHPVIVAEQAGRVVGYASLSRFSKRQAWSKTVELGLYLAHDVRARGIGTMLMQSILDRARDAGHHVVIGQIVADNEPSIRLGERMGFCEAGRLLEVGHKFDRTLDVVIQQLIL